MDNSHNGIGSGSSELLSSGLELRLCQGRLERCRLPGKRQKGSWMLLADRQALQAPQHRLSAMWRSGVTAHAG